MRVGIAGGAGYTGGELTRLLLGHPEAELAQVSSASHAGKPVHEAHPNLRGRTELRFTESVDPAGLDALFFAGGHGTAMERLPDVLDAAGGKLKVVDLSADFRLKDPKLYPEWYGREHAAPKLLERFVYGLSELNRDAISKTDCVANPGCFATAIGLALAPLAAAGLTGTARVSAVTGSSGSGAQPGAGTHYSTREGSLRAYKPLRHQHVPEIEAQLGGRLNISLVPVSGPLVRGIYAVCHLELPAGWDQKRVDAVYRDAYADRPFVRLLDAPPSLNAVTGSNFCDLHAAARGSELAVISALDNLVKGAAGQAVQNLNLMMGWPETAGLTAAGAYP